MPAALAAELPLDLPAWGLCPMGAIALAALAADTMVMDARATANEDRALHAVAVVGCPRAVTGGVHDPWGWG